LRGRPKKRGLIFDGISYDVDENKGRRLTLRDQTYDVHENKQLMIYNLRYI